jgi:trypsin
LRRLIPLAALALLAATPSALGASHVIGGSPIDVRSAPWSVLVLHRTGASGTLCSGAILDSLHVLTAAHCVVDNGVVVSAPTLTVRAGVTNGATPTPSDSEQDRQVASFRVHHGYVEGDRAGADDVAVLTLASPLDLSGPTARAIALPTPDVKWKIGDAVTVSGYGLKSVGGTIDGSLNTMTATLVDQEECLPPALNGANGVLLCAFSGTSSPCSGDSGAALVLDASTAPVLIGVTRASSCTTNSGASFADVTAPEILQFVEGNDDPPTAPRATSATTLERPTAVMQVGQTVTCKPGGWTGDPAFTYQFWEGLSTTMLTSGPSPTYRLRDGDASRTIFCRVIASNVGGTTYDESATPAAAVQNVPQLVVPAASARRGGTAVVRVRLVDWARPVGRIDVCLTLSPRVGGKTCRVVSPAGSDPTVVMQVRVKGTAPVVRARGSVTARAADGRSANRSAFVEVR